MSVIITEMVTLNGREFIRATSDSGMMIERDGARYSEAYDPVGLGRLYTETDEPIPDEAGGMTGTEAKAAAFDILMGVMA